MKCVMVEERREVEGEVGEKLQYHGHDWLKPDTAVLCYRSYQTTLQVRDCAECKLFLLVANSNSSKSCSY